MARATMKTVWCALLAVPFAVGTLATGACVEVSTSNESEDFAVCGDALCAASENAVSCAEDCVMCGDGICHQGETVGTCAEDCTVGSGAPAVCGNGSCDPTETIFSCPQDCDASFGDSCGDGTCEADEDGSSCPADCAVGGGAVCGDGNCDSDETCGSCAGDCGACGPICGDGNCESGENAGSCPADCSVDCCGDGTDPCGWNGDGACDIGCTWGIDSDCATAACVGDALEPNDTSPAASATFDGMTECGLSLCGGADVDWFELNVTSGFSLYVTFLDSVGDIDVEIYDGVTYAWLSGAYSGTDDELVLLNGLAAGTYWARTYVAGGGENPDYCVTVDVW